MSVWQECSMGNKCTWVLKKMAWLVAAVLKTVQSTKIINYFFIVTGQLSTYRLFQSTALVKAGKHIPERRICLMAWNFYGFIQAVTHPSCSQQAGTTALIILRTCAFSHQCLRSVASFQNYFSTSTKASQLLGLEGVGGGGKTTPKTAVLFLKTLEVWSLFGCFGFPNLLTYMRVFGLCFVTR